jgi:RNA 2',3'-cyclic 3'-phosphodiesterase
VSTLRLFFALWPDPPMQEALADAVREVLASLPGARAVPTPNLHLTLAFLGSVPAERVASLDEVAEQVTSAHRSVSSLELTFDRLDHWRQPRILCATASVSSERATSLAEALKRGLLEQGFAPDLKPFRAHVTLARQVSRAPEARELPPVTWPLEALALVHSRTDPSGSVYSIHRSWALCDSGGKA